MGEIEIESHFVCPISMQLMKDPVIVASGITYDRDSIEEWLYSYNNVTCPVTNVDLSGTDLTPNHTLRRLIQSWCIVNSGYGIDRIPTPSPPISKSQILKIFDESKKSVILQVQCLRKLKSISQANRSNKKCLVDVGGVEFLLSVLKNNDFVEDHDDNAGNADLKKTAKDEALYILCHLELSESDLKRLNQDEGIKFMETLIQVLKWGDTESRGQVIALLRSAYSVLDQMQLMGVNQDIFNELVHFLRSKQTPSSKQSYTKEALKLLLELCPYGRNKIKASDAGAVSVLIELLLDVDNKSEKRVSELIIASLDQLCRCAEGRAEFLKHEAGLAIVSKKIFRVSCFASEKAVRVIWSICKHCGNQRVVQEMVNIGVVAKLCLVMQSEINVGKINERTREILSMHSRVWKDSPCIPSNLSFYYP